MKIVKCEMCGNGDLVKQDGLFVCQACGTKYSVEEVKKLMVETDRTKDLKNIIKCIYSFLEAKNFIEAKEYCKKALEIDSENAEVLLCLAMCDNRIASIKDFLESKNPDVLRNAFYIKAKKVAKGEVADLINKKEEQYYFENGIYYSKDKTKLICVSNVDVESVKINIEVKEILTGAFYSCEKLTEIEVPEGVKEIKSHAFSFCSSLRKITLPNSLERVGKEAFKGCYNIEEMSLPFVGENSDGTGETDIGFLFQDYEPFDSAINKKSLRKITITGATEIGFNAFYGCDNLESIVLNDGVKGIKDSAFCFCKKLKKVEIPNTATYIGVGAFSHCLSLENIIIGNKVEAIGSEAFYCCESLRLVDIPNTVIEIEDGAFSNCTNLEKINLPENLIRIDSRTFANCEKLEDIVIPKTVKEIGEEAFCECKKLSNIKLPQGLETIHKGAFKDCSALKEIKFPNSLKLIDERAFWFTNLMEAILPTSVHYLKGYYSPFPSDCKVVKLGEAMHELGKEAVSKKTGGCYVATCVYGSYDCPEVWTLRRYRDDSLGATWYGRVFIRMYYAISPTLVKWFGKTKWFKKMWKRKLDHMVKKLQDKGVESTPYQDKEWRK